VLRVNTLNVRGKARRERTVQFWTDTRLEEGDCHPQRGDKIELA